MARFWEVLLADRFLPENPDQDAFRRTARELGIDEDVYIEALQKVTVKTREEIEHANARTKEIEGFSSKQRILVLNASIEAARA